VLVTINYRLGYFGFLASRELQAEAARNGEEYCPNQGLYDQRVALQWVSGGPSVEPVRLELIARACTTPGPGIYSPLWRQCVRGHHSWTISRRIFCPVTSRVK
jgi:hypothetical protein